MACALRYGVVCKIVYSGHSDNLGTVVVSNYDKPDEKFSFFLGREKNYPCSQIEPDDKVYMMIL